MKIDISKHILVPTHILLSKEEAKEVMKKYNVKPENLPKILESDPAIRELDAKPGQIVKIIRDSRTAGKVEVYRLVVKE